MKFDETHCKLRQVTAEEALPFDVAVSSDGRKAAPKEISTSSRIPCRISMGCQRPWQAVTTPGFAFPATLWKSRPSHFAAAKPAPQPITQE